MNIVCTICVDKLETPKWVDTNDYEGQISCKGCLTIWDVQFKKDKLQYFHPSGFLASAHYGIPDVFLGAFKEE